MHKASRAVLSQGDLERSGLLLVLALLPLALARSFLKQVVQSVPIQLEHLHLHLNSNKSSSM